MQKDVIALVGAGSGGTAILKALLNMPDVEIRYVYDINPDAPGMQLAAANGIRCYTDVSFKDLVCDPEVELIFEVSGKAAVFRKLRRVKRPTCGLLRAAGTKIIFHLLDTQRQTNLRLKDLMDNLESLIVKRTEELEKANVSLQDKIRDYARLTDKLQQVNDEKTRYLLHATHQLKAPFAAIQSYVDIILGGYIGEIGPQTSDILRKVQSRCQMLSNNIKEMLELANLKSCVVENLAMLTVDCKLVLPEVINSFRSVATERRIELAFASDERPALVKANAGQLQILFSILLENAIHYSPDASCIEVRIRTNGSGRVICSVKDQGIGIPEEHRGRIFDEYFRSNNAVAQHKNGSGLGLSIVAEIARIHGFTVEVDSELGQGSTFSVTMRAAELP